MPNVATVKHSKWLQVRSEPELLDMLDEMAAAERPPVSRSDMVRKLVYEGFDRRKKATRK